MRSQSTPLFDPSLNLSSNRVLTPSIVTPSSYTARIIGSSEWSPRSVDSSQWKTDPTAVEAKARDAFRLYDSNGTGRCNLHEFRSALRTLGFMIRFHMLFCKVFFFTLLPVMLELWNISAPLMSRDLERFLRMVFSPGSPEIGIISHSSYFFFSFFSQLIQQQIELPNQTAEVDRTLVSDMQLRLGQADNEIRTLLEENNSLKTQLGESRFVARETQEENARLKNVMGELSAARDTISNLTSQVNSLQLELAEADRVRNAFSILQGEMRDAQAAIETYRRKIEICEMQIENAKEQAEKNAAERMNLISEKEYAEAGKRALEIRATTLQNELADKMKSLELSLGKVRELESNLRTNETQLKSCENELHNVNTTLYDTRLQLENSRAHAATLTETVIFLFVSLPLHLCFRWRLWKRASLKLEPALRPRGRT